MRILRSTLAALLLASACTPALAEDWIAERLRGSVMQLEHGNWIALERGDVVADGQKVRTAGDGRLELVRGRERIALAANTEIVIRDAAGQKMTSVVQTFGSVTIEAERRNVQHFSVQTPVLAAIVKGTQFTVTYSNGRASVAVDRGVVQVQDNGHDMVVDVSPGQTAEASQASPLDVAGPGADQLVYLIGGEAVPAPAREAVLNGDIAAADALEAVQNRTVGNTDSNPGRQDRPAEGTARRDRDSAGEQDRNTPGAPDGRSGPPAHSNAGGNGNSNSNSNSNNSQNSAPAHSGENGPPAHSNENGPPAHSNAGGNGNETGNGHGHGNGPGNGNGHEHGHGNGNGNGPPDHSNAGGNGNGNGRNAALSVDLGLVGLTADNGGGLNPRLWL